MRKGSSNATTIISTEGYAHAVEAMMLQGFLTITERERSSDLTNRSRIAQANMIRVTPEDIIIINKQNKTSITGRDKEAEVIN